MLPDKIEHCIVFMNYWDVSGVFWSFSKCNIKIPHLPADPSRLSSCANVCKTIKVYQNDLESSDMYVAVFPSSSRRRYVVYELALHQTSLNLGPLFSSHVTSIPSPYPPGGRDAGFVAPTHTHPSQYSV